MKKLTLLIITLLSLVLVLPTVFGAMNVSINKTSFENPGFLPSSRILLGNGLSTGNITKGSTFNYQINISNIGDETIHRLNLTEYYPAGVEFNNATPAPDAGTNNTWTNLSSNLAVGGFLSVNISVNVSVLLANGTLLNNTVNASYTNITNGTLNFTKASSFLTARGIPSINITKADSPDAVNMNASFFYFINITNSGDDVAVNVTVVDLYPQGVNFTLGAPVPVLGNNTFSLGNMTIGQSVLVNISVNVTGAFANGTQISNTANATFTTFTRVNITNTSAVQNTTVRGLPSLKVTKLAPAQVRRGNQIVYNITVNNTGLDTALNVTLIETYPQGLILNSAVPAADVGNNTWLLGSVSPGNVTTVNITLNVSDSNLANGSVLANFVNASTVNVQGNTVTSNYSATNGSNATTVSTTVRGIPSINITKADTPDTVNINALLSYFVNVTNSGDDTAVNVTVMDLYPQGVNFTVSAPVPVLRNNTFSLSNMIPNQSILVNITVNVTGAFANGTQISNTANATFTDAFTTSITNTSAVQNTTVRGYPNLAVTKADAGFDPVNRNALFNYTVLINNTGNDTAFNVTLTENYPQGVLFVSAQPGATVGNSSWSLGNLSPGGTFLVNITLNLTGALANATVINNTVNTTFVNVQGVSVNTNHSQVNNSIGATQNTTVRGFPGLVMTKTDSLDPITRFQLFNYTILINNTGDDTALNITVNETYPQGIILVTAQPGASGENNSWNAATIGNLTPGAVYRLNITLNYTGQLANASIINNSVNASYVNVQGNSVFSNSTVATQNTTTRGLPLISMNKTDSSDPVVRGGTVNYTITISNPGDDTAINVSVVEIYAQGLFLNHSSPAASVGNNTFNIGNLTPGSFTTINITLNVSSALANATVINNTVNVSFVNVQGVANFSNKTNATQTTTIRGIPVINLTKTDSPDPVVSGSRLVYQVIINNTGDDTAFGVNVTEQYDARTRYDSSTKEPNVSNNVFYYGNLAPNQTRTINISMDVNSGLVGGVILNNTANFTWADFRGDVNISNKSQATEVTEAVQSSSGGGGGGGGSSSSSTTTTTTETPAVTAAVTASTTGANPQELKTVAVTDTIVSAVDFISAVRVENPSLVAKSLKEKPASIPAPVSANVFGYLNIETNLQARDLYYAAIKFSVPKSWLQEKGLKSGQIALNRLVNGQWVKLKTTLKSESGDKYSFEAKTPGFSYFAITAEEEVVETSEQAPPAQEQAPAEAQTTSTTADAVVKPVAKATVTKPNTTAWAIALILIVAIIVAIMVWRKNKGHKRFK